MRVVSFLLVFFLGGTALAQDRDLDRRVHNLSNELRCLVCQNQTLADSNAPLAVDLRNQVREQLAAGKSEEEVKHWLVERYGDFVLYRPPFKVGTLLLWAGPFLLLALGCVILVRRLRRKAEPPAELPAAERERAAKLLE